MDFSLFFCCFKQMLVDFCILPFAGILNFENYFVLPTRSFFASIFSLFIYFFIRVAFFKWSVYMRSLFYTFQAHLFALKKKQQREGRRGKKELNIELGILMKIHFIRV